MAHSIYRVLALRLREERRRSGYSLEALGERAGISGAFIAHIEAERKKPTLETVAKLAWALDTSVSELLLQGGSLDLDTGRLARLLQDLAPKHRQALLSILRAARDLVRRP